MRIEVAHVSGNPVSEALNLNYLREWTASVWLAIAFVTRL